jgi:hypothetical protein
MKVLRVLFLLNTSQCTMLDEILTVNFKRALINVLDGVLNEIILFLVMFQKIAKWQATSFNVKNINGKQDLCQDFGSSVPDSRCGNSFFYKKLDLINILEKICVSVYCLKDFNISYLKT